MAEKILTTETEELHPRHVGIIAVSAQLFLDWLQIKEEGVA